MCQHSSTTAQRLRPACAGMGEQGAAGKGCDSALRGGSDALWLEGAVMDWTGLGWAEH